jgi:hypothetical protein
MVVETDEDIIKVKKMKFETSCNHFIGKCENKIQNISKEQRRNSCFNIIENNFDDNVIHHNNINKVRVA